MKKILSLVCILALGISSVSAQELALVRENDLFGYINKSGEYAITPQFEKSGDFQNGYAPALKDGKWGFIDLTGNWVIQPSYDRVKDFNSGYALVLKDDQWNYIDTSEKILATPVKEKYYDFDDNGVAIYRLEEKIGLMGTDGKLIIEPTYREIKSFVDGYAKVQLGETWGMIDTKGKIFIPLEYDEIGDYSKNGIWARKGESFGVLIEGNFQIVDNANKIWDFNEDSVLTYARNKEDKLGFINSRGEWVIEPLYERAKPFSNGLAPVMEDKKWGYINENGKLVIDYNFKEAESFAENGLAPVVEKKLWGFIDKEGKMVIADQYDLIAYTGSHHPNAYMIKKSFSLFSNFYKGKGFHDGLVRVKHKKKWAFLNEKGEPLGGKWYKNLENFSK